MRVSVIRRDLGELAWVGGYASRVASDLTVLVLHFTIDGAAAADVMRQVLSPQELRAATDFRDVQRRIA